MTRLFFLGDVSWDLTLLTPALPGHDEKVHAEDFVEGAGGVACNAAVAAARIGVPVTFVGTVGDDSLSSGIDALLRAEGIDPRLSTTHGSICRVVTLIEPHGEKRLVLYPGVSLSPDAAVLGLIDWSGVDHLHTAVYGRTEREAIRRARAAGAGWSLDLEPSTFSTGLQGLAAEIDGAAVVFVNDRAAALVGEDAPGTLFGMGAHNVIRSRGPEGASLHDAVGETCVPAPSGIRIRDTTGAGDCLAGVYLARRARGDEPEAALFAAVRAATESCARIGAQPGYPPRVHENPDLLGKSTP